MNLITRSIENSSVVTFRSFQYSKIRELIALSLRYLFKFGFKYDPKIYNPDGSNIEFIDDMTYSGFNHFSTKLITVKLFKSTNFIRIAVPELYQETFFILNGVRYIPMYYVIDEPIVVKKRSIMISSLFQSITVYVADNRVTFMRTNIVLEDFIKIITETWDIAYQKEIESLLNITLTTPINSKTLTILGKKLKCPANSKHIKSKMNLLFFDEWTTQLYKKFYNINANLEDVFKIMFDKYIERQTTKIVFTDLRYKRLTFIEPLMNPFFKAIGRTVSVFLTNDFQKPNLILNLNEIVKHFFTELNGNCLYDTVNGYSSILSHKATFKNPFGTGILPKEISSIHWTHYNRLCIIAISNHNPGETIFLVPNQKIDNQFGMFDFSTTERARL